MKHLIHLYPVAEVSFSLYNHVYDDPPSTVPAVPFVFSAASKVGNVHRVSLSTSKRIVQKKYFSYLGKVDGSVSRLVQTGKTSQVLNGWAS